MTLSEKIQIPLFPLSVFLLPGERTQLHIFEPRYRQLFEELEHGDSSFGIPFLQNSLNGRFGSRCRLIRVLKRYNSGESDVLIESDGIFQLSEFNPIKEGKLYPYGTVILKRDLIKELASNEVIGAYDDLDTSLSGTDLHIHVGHSPFLLILMANMGLSHEDKYAFIQLPDAEARNKSLLGRIKLLDHLVKQEKATEQGIYLS